MYEQQVSFGGLPVVFCDLAESRLPPTTPGIHLGRIFRRYHRQNYLTFSQWLSCVYLIALPFILLTSQNIQ